MQGFACSVAVALIGQHMSILQRSDQVVLIIITLLFGAQQSVLGSDAPCLDFFNRSVSAWNSLPSFIVNSKYVASFKRFLVSVDLSKFLVYAV